MKKSESIICLYNAPFSSLYTADKSFTYIFVFENIQMFSHIVFKRFLHTFIMFIWLTLNPFRPKWCFKNFELNFINYRCCMHGYIKKLQTEALKFLLSEYFFFKYTFTRPISFLDQKSVRRSSNIFCIYSYVKFEPPSWPNPTPKIMIMSVKSSDYMYM